MGRSVEEVERAGDGGGDPASLIAETLDRTLDELQGDALADTALSVADLWSKLGRADLAAKSIERSTLRDPSVGQRPEIALRLSTARAEGADFPGALAALEGFEASIKAVPGKAKQRTLLARAEIRRGVALLSLERAPEALPHLERATSLKPPAEERPLLLVYLGMALVGCGRPEDALRELRAAAQLVEGAESSMVRMWIGIALVRSGDAAQALKEFEAARATQPEGVMWPLLPLYTAQALAMTGDHQRALEQAKLAEDLQIVPYLRALAIVQQAFALVQLNRSGEVLDCLDRIPLPTVQGTDLAEPVVAWMAELRLKSGRVVDAALGLEAADEMGLDWRASPRLVAVRVNVKIQQGLIEEASEALDRAQELEPAARLLLESRKAGLMLMAGKGDLALELYGSIADVEPGADASAVDKLAVGAARVTLGRADEAAPMLEEALRMEPAVATTPEYQYASLGVAMARRQFDEAIDIARALLEGPIGSTARVMLGFALEGKGDALGAAEAFRLAATAPETDPMTKLNAFVAWTHLAIAEVARGRLGEARAAVSEAQQRIDAEPALASAPLRYQFEAARALVELKSGNGDRAVEHAKEAYRLAPSLRIRGAVASASLLLGRLLAAEERQEKALSAFGRSTQEDPGSADAWMGLGQAHLALQEPSDALAAFEAAAEHSAGPDGRFEALMAQGRALTDLLRHEEAVVRFRAALDLRPTDLSVWQSLGAAYASLGRNSAAHQAFDRGWRLDSPPRSAELAVGTTAALLSEGLNQEAVDFLKRAEPTTAPDPRMAFNRGVALYRLGRVSEAVEAWTMAASGPAGIERARELAAQFRSRPTDPTSWFDYWFGRESTTARKVGGASLILLLAAVLIPSLVSPAQVSWLGWVNDSGSWPRVLAPALVAIGLLILPTVTSLKVGPVSVEPREAEAAVKIPGPSVESIIQDVMKATSMTSLRLPAAAGKTVTQEFAEVSLDVLPLPR